MTRRLLTALAAALVIYGSVFMPSLARGMSLTGDR